MTIWENRYERDSIILTSNKGFAEWGGILGESVIAAATLDWLLHHSHVVNIRGESYRLKDKHQADIFPSHQLLDPAAEPFSNQSTQPQVGQI